MAVVVPITDTNISTPSAFYRVESYNMPTNLYSTSLALSTVCSKEVTFSNAGNVKGVAMPLFCTNTILDRSLVLGLQEKKGTFTTTIASPAIFTMTSHGFSVGDEVILTTTGSLPTGITKDTIRYYIYPTEVSPRNMTTDSSPSPFVVSASSYSGAGYEPYKAFDGSISLWRTNVTSSGWLKLDMSSTYKVTDYSIYTASAGSAQNPKDWTLEGSNDDSSWDILDTRTGIQMSSTGTYTYSFSNTTAYRYYRLNVSASNGGAYVYIYELHLHEQNVNTFCLVTNPSDTAVVSTSGSQSGVHTLWITRTSDTYTTNQIIPTGTYTGLWFTVIPLEFTTPYAIDTTVSKWRIYMVQTGGTTGNFNWPSSSVVATDSAYLIWCDNVVSFTNDDTLVCTKRVTLDTSVTVKGILPTGRTDNAIATIVCRSLDITENGISNLLWDETPTSSNVLGVDGTVLVGSWAGIQIGSSTNPISYANQAVLEFLPNTVGTLISYVTCFGGSSLSRPLGRGSFIAYGEIPTARIATLAVDAETAQDKLTLVEDFSSDWQIGDRIFIGKQNIKSVGLLTVHTINAISGTQITLNTNLVTYKRYAGGKVINMSRGYGIMLRHSTTGATTSRGLMYNSKPIFLHVSGVYFRDVNLSALAMYVSYQYGVDTQQERTVVEDNLLEYTQNTQTGYLYGTDIIPRLGGSIKRNHCVKANFAGVIGASYSASFKSGTLDIEDNVALSIQSVGQAVGAVGTTNVKLNINNNIWTNATTAPFVTMNGQGSTLTNNVLFGASCVTGALSFGTLSLNAVISGNTFDNNVVAISWYAGGFTVDATSNGDSFGQEVANTSDLTYVAGTYAKLYFSDTIGLINGDQTYISDTITGTRVGFTNENGVPNNSRSVLTEGFYTKTGTGLADTTVRTTGGFALRFESNVVELAYTQIIPTGNISGKTMTINVWCNINTANYYSGVYELPKLKVTYDDITTVIATATSTTGWQLLSLPFTPATTFGQIRVVMTSETDQVGSDAYVYWDDMGVLYPAGVALSLGGMDLWATGQPISPMIATGINPNDIWAVDTSTLTAPGTTGKKLVDDLTVVKFLGLK